MARRVNLPPAMLVQVLAALLVFQLLANETGKAAKGGLSVLSPFHSCGRRDGIPGFSLTLLLWLFRK